MFDFVSDIIADGNYEEIEGILSDLEYYTERAKEALKSLVHDVEYTWTNEQYNVTHKGVIRDLRCNEESLNDWVAETLCEDGGDLYETANHLFSKLGFAYKDVDYNEWMDEFIENSQISYHIISQDN